MIPQPAILLKRSGERSLGPHRAQAVRRGARRTGGVGLDRPRSTRSSTEIVDLRHELGVDVAVVVGGGNFWRGRDGAGAGMDRAQADYMGMLATVINALALQDALEQPRAAHPGADGDRDAARSPSPTSAAGPSATSRRAGS